MSDYLGYKYVVVIMKVETIAVEEKTKLMKLYCIVHHSLVVLCHDINYIILLL